ncbi:MAG: hypothetical protein HYZ53_00770, partial [Planctomycetes bacterium]|nr:hypothetical protein [Planctomycetota bacterium]
MATSKVPFVLVLCPDAALATELKTLLTPLEFRVRSIESLGLALAALSGEEPDVFVLRVPIGTPEWAELIRDLPADHPDMPVIVICRDEEEPLLSSWTKHVFDFLRVPLMSLRVQVSVRNAIERRHLDLECRNLRTLLEKSAAATDESPSATEQDQEGDLLAVGTPAPREPAAAARNAEPPPERERRVQVVGTDPPWIPKAAPSTRPPAEAEVVPPPASSAPSHSRQPPSAPASAPAPPPHAHTSPASQPRPGSSFATASPSFTPTSMQERQAGPTASPSPHSQPTAQDSPASPSRAQERPHGPPGTSPAGAPAGAPPPAVTEPHPLTAAPGSLHPTPAYPPLAHPGFVPLTSLHPTPAHPTPVYAQPARSGQPHEPRGPAGSGASGAPGSAPGWAAPVVPAAGSAPVAPPVPAATGPAGTLDAKTAHPGAPHAPSAHSAHSAPVAPPPGGAPPAPQRTTGAGVPVIHGGGGPIRPSHPATANPAGPHSGGPPHAGPAIPSAVGSAPSAAVPSVGAAAAQPPASLPPALRPVVIGGSPDTKRIGPSPGAGKAPPPAMPNVGAQRPVGAAGAGDADASKTMRLTLLS